MQTSICSNSSDSLRECGVGFELSLANCGSQDGGFHLMEQGTRTGESG